MRKTERGILEQMLLYLISVLLVVFLGWVLIHASGNIPMAKNIFRGKTYRIIFPGSGLAILLMALVLLKSSKLQEKYLKIGIGLIGCIIVLLQFLYLYNVRVFVNYDNLLILNEAVEMQATGKIDPSFSNEYFLRYPHNYPMVILLYYVLRLARMIGFDNVYWSAALFGMLCMDVALAAGAGIVKKMYGWRQCLVYFVFCMFNPIIYVWIPWYYTTLSGMPFFMASVYFALCAGKSESKKGQMIYGTIFGIVFGLGIRIRVTTAIFMIALIICGFVWKCWKKKNIQYLITASAISMVAVLCVCSLIQKKFVDFTYEDKAFPATHFVMMGMGGEGTYKAEDVSFTQSYSKKQEKVEATLEETERRIRKLGPTGFIKLMGRKLVITWQDGSAGLQDRWMHEVEPSNGYLYLIGEKNDVFLAYMQIYYVMNLILVLLGTICSMIKKRTGFNLLLRVTLLGVMMFYMLWEAQNRYSILMTFVFIILGLDGLHWVAGGIRKIIEKWGADTVKVGYGAGVVVLGGVLAVVLYHPVFKQSISYCDYSVRNLYNVGENVNNIIDNDVITQTFVTDRAFDAVYVSGGFVDNEHARGGCLLEISKVDGNIIASRELMTEEVAAGQLALTFDTVVPEKKTEYTIRISPKGVTIENPMYLQRFDGAIDIYPAGQLMRGSEKENGDLIFTVCQNKNEKYL